MAEPDPMRLAAIAADVAAEWGVELGDPFALSRFSFVAPAGVESVLKVTPPDDDESDQEADALELWDGDGAVRLLRCDRCRRAMLLERARPGTDISGLPEDDATAIAVEVGAASLAAGGGAVPLDRRSRAALARPGRALRAAGERPRSSRPRAATRRSTSAGTFSCTATFTTTTFSAPATGTSRSTRRRCSVSRSTTFRRSCGTRSGSGTGWNAHHRAATGGIRGGRPRWRQDAQVGTHPLRLPRRGRARGCPSPNARGVKPTPCRLG